MRGRSQPRQRVEASHESTNSLKANQLLPGVSVTTVYFGSAVGERETADAVGQLLKAPVASRTPEVADQPPGVIVVVAG
jgi:hypothetical protein